MTSMSKFEWAMVGVCVVMAAVAVWIYVTKLA